MSAFDDLYVAEKSSLAEAIAEALAERVGAKPARGDGFLSVGPHRVTWLSGHMYDNAKPEAYGPQWATWDVESLPIEVPWEGWKRVVPPPSPPGKDGRAFPDKRIQLRKIEGLLRGARRIVNAGDAAREGQLLVDEVLEEAGIDPFDTGRVYRLWVNSYTRKDMLAALEAMRPNADKRTLFQSALCRQRADWLHGMNMTTLYSKLAELSGVRATINVGRVMTPTLALVVNRDRERLAFKPVDHYLPQAVFEHANGSFSADWVIPADHEGLDSEGRLIDRAVAERVHAAVSGKPGRVDAYRSENKSTPPPLPFSLSALQAECGAKLGLTAQQTLDAAQALYETHKATTYPRSDSRHLPLSILKEEAPAILRALGGAEELAGAARGADPAIRSAAWDDSKVSDHHAIVPTTEFSAAKLERMSPAERAVFLIVARAFLCQFYGGFRYRALAAEIACEGHRFKATGRQVVDRGWRAVFGAVDAAEAEEEEGKGEEAAQSLPAMAQGDAVRALEGRVAAKRTTPPPAFTDGSLITAMTQVHRFVTDPEVKRRLRENDGIGTEATRAATIQKLLGADRTGRVVSKTPMLERKGKTGLQSTEFGRSVIDLLPQDLKDPGLTALWEGLLAQVERGALDPRDFMDKQAKSIAARVAAAKGQKVAVKGVRAPAPVRPLPGDGEACPECGVGLMKTRELTSKKDGKKYKLLACTNYPSCRHAKFESDLAAVEPLPGDGAPCPACAQGAMKTREVTSKKDGKKYKLLACSRYPECKHSVFPERPPVAPLPGDGKPCPGCGAGKLRTKEFKSKKDGAIKRMLSCDAYPACNHAEWPDDRKPPAPLPGDGKPCPGCGAGKLRTKEFKSKKDGAIKRMLSCETYPACGHAEWPDDGPPRAGGGKDRAPPRGAKKARA